MTDRVRHLTVILDKDVRVDDAQEIIQALKMNRFVADVVLGPPPTLWRGR